MTYTGKLYGRLGGVFVDTGLHTSDVDELTAAVKRLEALYEIAVGNIAFNSDELDESGVRAMIERHYEDIQKEAQHAS